MNEKLNLARIEQKYTCQRIINKRDRSGVSHWLSRVTFEPPIITDIPFHHELDSERRPVSSAKNQRADTEKKSERGRKSRRGPLRFKSRALWSKMSVSRRCSRALSSMSIDIGDFFPACWRFRVNFARYWKAPGLLLLIHAAYETTSPEAASFKFAYLWKSLAIEEYLKEKRPNIF